MGCFLLLEHVTGRLIMGCFLLLEHATGRLIMGCFLLLDHVTGRLIRELLPPTRPSWRLVDKGVPSSRLFNGYAHNEADIPPYKKNHRTTFSYNSLIAAALKNHKRIQIPVYNGSYKCNIEKIDQAINLFRQGAEAAGCLPL